jgi:hypothetical protein
MDMGLNSEVPSATPPRHMAKTGPRKKLRGLMAPLVTVDSLDQILELENEAYVAMGGESKKSLSDIVSEALNEYVSAWLHDNGSLPTSPAERREFVKRLAARNLEKLREQLLTKQ